MKLPEYNRESERAFGIGGQKITPPLESYRIIKLILIRK